MVSCENTTRTLRGGGGSGRPKRGGGNANCSTPVRVPTFGRSLGGKNVCRSRTDGITDTTTATTITLDRSNFDDKCNVSNKRGQFDRHHV